MTKPSSMSHQAVQLRNRHSPAGVGDRSGEESQDQPEGQPHIIPVYGHEDGDQKAGGDEDRVCDGGGDGGGSDSGPALLP